VWQREREREGKSERGGLQQTAGHKEIKFCLMCKKSVCLWERNTLCKKNGKTERQEWDTKRKTKRKERERPTERRERRKKVQDYEYWKREIEDEKERQRKKFKIQKER
jgi:hypothetical protein